MASLAETTAANKAAGPKPGQVWYEQRNPLTGRALEGAAANPSGLLDATNGVAGFWGDPSLQNQNGFLAQAMQGVGDALPTVVPLAIAAGTGYGLYNSGLIGGGAGAAASSVAPEVAGTGLLGGAATVAPEVAAGGLGADAAAYTGAGLTAGSGTTGLTSGGLSGLSAGSTIGNSIATDVAANTLAPSLGATGLIGAGAAAAGAGAAGTAGTAAGAAGAATVAKDLIPGVPNGLLGAVVGALGSGSSSTSTTADRSPWAPAQEWMKANLATGQQLQKQYQDNPFSAFQKQAYNNSAGLGNQFRGMVNSVVPQMSSFKPYQRTPQSQVATPYNFGASNLGMTQNPFGG